MAERLTDEKVEEWRKQFLDWYMTSVVNVYAGPFMEINALCDQALSGPMFEQSQHGPFKSIYGKEGAHYNIFSVSDGMLALREFFPGGECDEMNLVFFSTSGVHGTYVTIEEIAKNKEGEEGICEITFLIVQPRIVCLRYGNCKPVTEEDFSFLRKLRRSSWEVSQTIGSP